MAVTFSILGPLEVRNEERAASLGGRRQRAVLALLLLRANEVVSVDALADGLWGGKAPANPARSLQVFVSDLRKALRPLGLDGRIVTQAPGYQIDVQPGELDAARAETLAAEGRHAEALGLWRGEPLVEFAYEPFAAAPIARLQELRLSLVEERLAADLAAGRHTELVGELEELVARHPYREGLRAQLILALYRSGRQSDALAAYSAARTLLVEELGIDPKPELQELERAILRQDASLDLPAPVKAAPAPTGLVGRERELEELEALVRTERLVTLTGTGGIGKTSLARAVCERVAGARFVALAAVADPALVPSTVALALGVEDADELPEALAGAELLLCLDNLEQVLDAAPFVAELLERCPGVRVLATSRSALRLAGEREMPLDPLDADAAVELFAARAAAVSPGFEADQHEEAIRGICERLDNLPLALELAAGRARLLSPQGILDRLGQALALLAGGPRDRPERQQTLRAAIDWSYRLLEPEEAMLFRALSACRSGFDLAAAVALAGRDELDVLDPLSGLIEHSLVRRREEDGEPRFLLLETIREFAAEQLEKAGEAEDVRARHAAHYLAFAEPGSLPFDSDELTAWLPRAEREQANLRAALAWLVETGAADDALVLARRLSSLWIHRGPLAEGGEWLARALALPGGEDAVRAAALGRAGLVASQRGRYEEAQRHLAESLAFRRRANEPAELASDLVRLGVVTSAAGDFDGAREAFEEAVALGRALADARVTSSALNNLGELARLVGDLETARARYEESLALDLERGSGYGVALRRLNLGALALEEGDLDGAEAQVRAALEPSVAISADDTTLSCVEVAGAAAARRGEHARAARLLAATAALRAQLGFVLPASERPLLDATAALVEAALPADELAEARAAGAASSLEDVVASVLSGR